jgi:hypothetical protein
MNTKPYRLPAAVRRLKATPLSGWPRLFERWLPRLAKAGPKERDRIFPARLTFWLFFSPGPLPRRFLP